MADRFYGMARGDNKATVSTSTTGFSMELTIDDAVNLTRRDIYLALERISEAVLEDEGFTAI